MSVLERRVLHLVAPALAATMLLVAGCENQIEPFSEEGSYSIYGYLSSNRDVQFVRVKPLHVPITKLDSNSVDATVTLENLTEGTSEVLADSIITYDDGATTVITHNFWTDTPITPGTRYRVTVVGPQGEVAWATTTTPTHKEPKVRPRQGKCRDRFKVHFEGIEDPRRVRLAVAVKYADSPQKNPWLSLPQKQIFKNDEGEVVFLFRPSLLLTDLAERIHFPLPELPSNYHPYCWDSHRCLALDADDIQIRYAYLGSEWYGDIPEDSLTYDPLQSHDVSGGHGFFGSVRRGQTHIEVDTANYINHGCGQTGARDGWLRQGESPVTPSSHPQVAGP